MSDAQKWIDAVVGATGSGAGLERITPQDFTRNSKLTRDGMAKFLCQALKVVSNQMRNLQEFQSEYEKEMCQALDTSKQLIEEAEAVKAKSAIEVVDLQREVLDLQRELLNEKNRQLDELKASVVQSVKSVGDTVKAEIKSYSAAVQQSSQTQQKSTNLKTVVKKVVEEQDRSKSFMVFGMKEEKNENLHNKIESMLFELNQKPRIAVCRVGLRGMDSGEVKSRPVKVSVDSSLVVAEVMIRAKQLKNTDQYAKVFLSPDRTPQQREDRKNLVTELKRRVTAEPDRRHFIRRGAVVTLSVGENSGQQI